MKSNLFTFFSSAFGVRSKKIIARSEVMKIYAHVFKFYSIYSYLILWSILR